MCEARKRLRTWGKGIALASAVTQGVLLDAATHLIESVASELDDAKDTSGAGGGLGAGQAMAFLLSLEGIQRRDSHPRTEVFSALGQPVLMHGARPSRDQVHSSGPWDDPSLVSGLRCQ